MSKELLRQRPDFKMGGVFAENAARRRPGSALLNTMIVVICHCMMPQMICTNCDQPYNHRFLAPRRHGHSARAHPPGLSAMPDPVLSAKLGLQSSWQAAPPRDVVVLRHL